MSEEKLRLLGGKSEVMSDLYALKQMLFESEIMPKKYYLERIEGAFERPSFLIKIVGWNVIPRNDAYSKLREEVMIQYFSEDYFDAKNVSMQVVDLLTRNHLGMKDCILPRYDFSKEPPEKISVTGLDADGNATPNYAMGARIDPSSISVNPFQEEDERWTIPITFTMDTPVIPVRPGHPTIENIEHTISAPTYRVEDFILEAGVSSKIDIEEVED